MTWPSILRRSLTRSTAAALLVVAWALAVLPNLTVRSFVWEEGRCAELARDVLERGDLLQPAIYGSRYVEKPSLLSWMIAGVARLTGKLDESSARLPSILAVLITTLIVFYFARRFVSEKAAFFAGVCFLFCP